MAGKLEPKPNVEFHLCCFPKYPSRGAGWADCCLIQVECYVLMCLMLRNLVVDLFCYFLLAFLFTILRPFVCCSSHTSKSGQINLADSPCANRFEYKNKLWESPQVLGEVTCFCLHSTECYSGITLSI